MTSDLRNEIFASLAGKRFTARIRMSESGLVCGLDAAREKLADLGLKVLASLHDGEEATPETEILVFQGTAQAVAMAEDCVIGCIAKYSGIARAARKASELSGDLVRVGLRRQQEDTGGDQGQGQAGPACRRLRMPYCRRTLSVSGQELRADVRFRTQNA